jgi:hypothetical protein
VIAPEDPEAVVAFCAAREGFKIKINTLIREEMT